MLELLRCAQHMDLIEEHINDDPEFTRFAKKTFTKEFHAINTDLHWFALFLHPLCRRLAISQASKSKVFTDAENFAIHLAQKWQWTEKAAVQLLRDLQTYSLGHKPFSGGLKNAQTWWEELPVSSIDCPLKSMALSIFALVPHSAEVERLFSSLGGIQGVRRSLLDVQTFERLGKMRCHLNSLLHDEAAANGRTLRQQHAHMHTQTGGGINEDLITQLQQVTEPTPTAASPPSEDVDNSDPSNLSVEDLDEEFERLDERESDELAPNMEGGNIDQFTGPEDNSAVPVGEVYNLVELQKVLEGVAPTFVAEDPQIHHGVGASVSWDRDTLKMKAGLL